MNNNATWTVIDRGEPDSYFAIWDLVDYLGSGGMLKDECKLLREAWEEMALTNSAVAKGASGSNELLEIVMRDYDIKLKMYNFVQALIFCLVPKSGCRYDADLADNFEKVLKSGCSAITSNGGIFDPKQLIEKGVELLKEKTTKGASAAVATVAMAEINAKGETDVHMSEAAEPTESAKKRDSGQVDRPNKRQRMEQGETIVAKTETENEFKVKFDLVPGNEGYKLATVILNETMSTEWTNHFSYYSDTFRAAIIEKGRHSYLVRRIFLNRFYFSNLTLCIIYCSLRETIVPL